MSSPPPPATTQSPTSPPTSDATSPPPPPPQTTSNFTSPPLDSGSPPPTTVAVAPKPPSGLPPGAVAGLVIGTVFGAVIVLIAVGIYVIFYRKRKKKLSLNSSGLPPPGGAKGDLQHWQHNAPQISNLPRPSPPLGIISDPHLPPVNVYPSAEPPSTSSSMGYEKSPHPSVSPGVSLGLAQSTFAYEELVSATNNFAESNLLGQGGFGYVHKGVLPNGKVVAVKQLKAGSGQGEREFQAEVEIISRVHHRHLVSLVGYCIAGDERLLVYEFIPNKTLEFHLHGKGRPVMSWSTRMRIALAAAKGLAYLHEDCHPKIIHRDIKAANILLDDSFEAKVADFGLARSALDTDTHVSTRVMGTFGYLAPEYASTGKLTEKSDVFSFGVVLLELISGRRPVDRTQMFSDESLVDWARSLFGKALESRNFDALVDPRLRKDYEPNEMAQMVACAAASVRHSAKRRPRMSQIVRALEGNMSLDDLNEGITPGHSTVYSSYGGSTDYSSSQYGEDLKKFRKMALESEELDQDSSEYSVVTSECGINPSSSSTEGQKTTQETELPKVEKDSKEFKGNS